MKKTQNTRRKAQGAKYKMQNRMCLVYCVSCLVFLCSMTAALAENESTQNTPAPAAWEKWLDLPVVAVEYECDGSFPKDEIVSATVVQTGDIYSRIKIRESIERIYSLGHFSDIKVDARSARKGVILTFILTRQIKTGQIYLKGNENLDSEEIFRMMKLKSGQKYSNLAAEADIESIKERYKYLGYFSTNISLKPDIDEKEKLVNITFNISEGVQTRVAEIIFTGTVEATLRPHGTAGLLEEMKEVKRGKVYRGQRSLSSDVKLIEDAYKEKGYITAKVVNTWVLSDPDIIKQYRDRGKAFPAKGFQKSDLKGGKVTIVIEIKQGRRIYIKVFEDDKEIKDDDIKKSTAVWRMGSVSEPVVSKSAEDIENLYRLKGYYKAKVDTQVLRDRPESITVIFQITKNRLMRVGKITIVDPDGGDLKMDVKRIKKQMLTRKRHLLSFWPFKRYFPSGVFDRAIFEADKRAIIALYKYEGYSNASIHDDDVYPNEETGKIDITIEISEGEKIVVIAVILEGNHEDVFSNTEILSYLSGKGVIPKFDKQNLHVESLEPPRARYEIDPPVVSREDDIIAARSYLRLRYADKGYLAQIEPVEKNEEPNKIVIIYQIVEGKRIRIDDEIEIRGNTRTKRWVIEKELSDTLTVEKVFNRTEIEESWQRLLDLGFLESVRIDAKPVLGSEDLYKLTVDVKDRKALSVNMHFGSGSSEYFRAGVEATHINLWGTGRRGRFNAEIGTKGSRGELDYAEPRFLGTAAIGVVNLHRYPEVYRYLEEEYEETWTGGKLGISQKIHRVNTLLYQYGYDSVEYQDDAGSGEATIGKIEAVFQRDRRNNPLNPTKGWFHSLSLEYADSWLGGTEAFAKFTINSIDYIQVSRNVVLALGARAGYAWELGDIDRSGQERFRPEQFKHSDYRTPRGFEWGIEDAGNAMLHVSTELRFPIYKWIGAAVFLDSGLCNERRDFRFSRMNSAVGLGLRLITPVGPLRLDYGYPVHGDGVRYKWPHVAFGHAF